jgi:DNA-binding transcriptional regulator YiaG
MDWPWAVAAAVIDEATSEANHGGWSVQVAESIDQELDGITSSRAVRYFDAHGWETISDVYAAAGLTERQQGIVTRRIYGGEYAVIAADVSSTPEAVRQEYRRALAELGKLLKSLDAPLPNVTPPLYTHRGADSADAVEQTRAMLDNLPSDALADLDDGEARALRETAGLSLRAVAQMIGTPPSTVARWERGARSPRPSEASRRYVALVETWRGPSVANCHRKGVTGDGTNIPPPKILSARQMRRRREREIAVEPTTLELMALDRALIDPRTPRN